MIYGEITVRQIELLSSQFYLGGYSMFSYNFFARNRVIKLKFDDKERELFKKYKPSYNETTHYFQCHLRDEKNAPRVYLHRLIGNIPDGKVGDHINGDVYDFRESNIQGITQQENCWKQMKTLSYQGKSTSSRYKGTGWCKKYQKWYAYIRIDYVLLNLGYYDNLRVAAVVYNVYARWFFGRFANLNKAKVTKAELSQVNFQKLNRNARKNLTKHGLLNDVAKLVGKD